MWRAYAESPSTLPETEALYKDRELKNLLALLLLLLPGISPLAWSQSGSVVKVNVNKHEDGQWTLTYELPEPTHRLGFVRNPDDSRTKRWFPESAEFELVYQEGKEYLQRVDGDAFADVSVSLTPDYKHLTKDYAPFSPYSDGGTLIYSGRLFSCPRDCSGYERWQFTLTAPANEYVVVHGQRYAGKASWDDENDGTNVYVGSQQPVETDNVIAIIDSGLPDSVQKALNTEIPRLMNYFEQRLGKITGTKPSLFASYARVDGHSSQGGTLPNQIFMHWDLNNLDERKDDTGFINDTLWFFAHEVAHLYQTPGHERPAVAPEYSWIHEGHADWLAARALTDLYPLTQTYVQQRIMRATADCENGLSMFSLKHAAASGRFGLYYTCGLLIHRSIDNALRHADKGDTFSLWRAFRALPVQEDQNGSTRFISLIEKDLPTAFVQTVRQLSEQALPKPQETLMRLESESQQIRPLNAE